VNEVSSSKALKVTSDSSHEEKRAGTKTNYEATYLVVKYCYSGSTFVGAYQSLKDAVLVTAQRVGYENRKGVIAILSEPDVITTGKKVDPAALTP